MTVIRPEDRRRFADHASPEAVASAQKKAIAALKAAKFEVEWLTELLERRSAEKAVGVWP